MWHLPVATFSTSCKHCVVIGQSLSNVVRYQSEATATLFHRPVCPPNLQSEVSVHKSKLGQKAGPTMFVDRGDL